jgi:hypothetical protein
MLASITPLGERARRSNWATTTVFYLGGSVAAGAALGVLAGLLGSAVFAGVAVGVRLMVVAAALGAGIAWELARGSVPGPRRQVNEQWLDRYRGWVYGLGFGAQLGAGVTTIVVSSSVYGVWLAALASGKPGTGLVIGICAGAFRGATVLASARVVTPQRLVILHQRLARLGRPTRAVGLAVQLALAGAAVLAVVL